MAGANGDLRREALYTTRRGIVIRTRRESIRCAAHRASLKRAASLIEDMERANGVVDAIQWQTGTSLYGKSGVAVMNVLLSLILVLFLQDSTGKPGRFQAPRTRSPARGFPAEGFRQTGKLGRNRGKLLFWPGAVRWNYVKPPQLIAGTRTRLAPRRGLESGTVRRASRVLGATQAALLRARPPRQGVRAGPRNGLLCGRRAALKDRASAHPLGMSRRASTRWAVDPSARNQCCALPT